MRKTLKALQSPTLISISITRRSLVKMLSSSQTEIFRHYGRQISSKDICLVLESLPTSHLEMPVIVTICNINRGCSFGANEKKYMKRHQYQICNLKAKDRSGYREYAISILCDLLGELELNKIKQSKTI